MPSGDTGVTVVAPLSGTATFTISCPTGPGSSVPNPPTLLSVSQASTRNADGTTTSILVFGAIQNPVTGSLPVASLKLYRGTAMVGPFSTPCDLEPISSFVVVNQLFDNAPIFGTQEYYVATAIDTAGRESAPSNVLFYTASVVTLGLLPGSLPPAAFGPYPILGSDVYLDPTTCEGVIGPNSDLLTVNGLECLAQDLRIRILTDPGELRLHPDFGLSKSKVIGSGQAKPQVQAQILRADIIDVLRAEPRVYKILDVQITSQPGPSGFIDSWIIGYDIMAINVEDPLHLNMVYPYSALTTAA